MDYEHLLNLHLISMDSQMLIGSAVQKQEDPLLAIAFIFVQILSLGQRKSKQQLRGLVSNQNIEHLLPQLQN